MNLFYYTSWIKNSEKQFILTNKKVAIIAHGGGDERSFEHYKEYILKPLNYLFKTLNFKLIGLENQIAPFGVVFGINNMKESESSIFPDMVHNWEDIEKILTPLILEMIKS